MKFGGTEEFKLRLTWPCLTSYARFAVRGNGATVKASGGGWVTKPRQIEAHASRIVEKRREREVKGHHVLFMLDVVSALSVGHGPCPLAYFTSRTSP